MRVALLGFGLIGGSIARALRRDPADWSLAAWTPTNAGPAVASAEDLIDRASATAEGAIRGADLVILAAPPIACLSLIDDLAGPWSAALSPEAVVTDVASTKVAIVARAEERGLRFVGGHPMAGRESSGFEAARGDLFVDRPWVVVPSSRAEPGDTGRVEALARACGARPIELTARDHDAAAAAISHFPLVVAAALVEAVAGSGRGPARPDWPVAASLAASGWESMTRLARGDATMAAGIAATNAPAIAERVRELRAALDAWLAELERVGGPDAAAITERFAAARRRLEAHE
jgi:prephenate dehydrogenase